MITVSYICILCIILLLMEFYYTMLNYEHLSLFLVCIGFVNHVLSMGIVQVMDSNHVSLNRLVTLHIKHSYIEHYVTYTDISFEYTLFYELMLCL